MYEKQGTVLFVLSPSSLDRFSTWVAFMLGSLGLFLDRFGLHKIQERLIRRAAIGSITRMSPLLKTGDGSIFNLLIPSSIQPLGLDSPALFCPPAGTVPLQGMQGSVRGTVPVYDPNGNMTSKTEISTGDTTTYTYNAENQLTELRTPNNELIQYAYDALGRRIQKNVNGTLTRYVYDNEDILEEYDGTNTLQARYTHGPGIDEPLTMERDLDLNGSLETTLHTLQDGLGSVTALTDTTGAVVERYDYDSFGNLTIKDLLNNILPESAFQNPYTYTGREHDPESGLYYYRARYMDPRTGRFLQEDLVNSASVQLPNAILPTRFPQLSVESFLSLPPLQQNQYIYAMDNPVNNLDPLGLITCRTDLDKKFNASKFADCILRVQNRVGSGASAIIGLAAACAAAIKLPAPPLVKIVAIATTCSLPVLIVTNCFKEASQP